MKIRKTTTVIVAAIVFSVPYIATADIIPVTDTMADYDSPRALPTAGFPIDRGVIGTFTFAAGDMLAATVSGTWGNVNLSTSSATDVFLDDILVAQCVRLTSCTTDNNLPVWSYVFTAADLLSGVLNDGMADMRVVQTSFFAVHLGSLAFVGQVEDGRGQVPEPGTLALLGIGLVGMGLTRRRKKI